MTELLPPSAGFSATALALSLEPLPSAQLLAGLVDAGDVKTGVVELGAVGGVSFGLWEHTAGVSTDVEADEVFVVVSGRGRVEIAGSADEPATVILLEPGTIARLAAGSRTIWTIEEPLRKVWFAG
ncbi:cupin [Frondihabitans sucicola]|uniref:Cupin n=1 Tax=Frondihabitans sucicola TaxID=1268041 RepID=A0ABN6Y657_9MICO|nr:cupin domain-containing protein [Frondihabitans sucicola]BDZ51481.1 cupin [Frondihabitans sucicola]